MSGLLAVALGTSLAQTIETSQVAQNQLMPTILAAEILDRIRTLPYWYINSNIAPPSGNPQVPAGTYQIPINSNDTITGGIMYAFQNPPLAIDTSTYQWTASPQPNPAYQFEGQAYVELTPDANGNGVTATAKIQWFDPGGTTQRQYNLTTYVSAPGVHD